MWLVEVRCYLQQMRNLQEVKTTEGANGQVEGPAPHAKVL
jgi:hypothetical protein